MADFLKLLAAAILLAVGVHAASCSSQIPPDQRLGVSLSVPGMGTGHLGWASGAAAVAQSVPAQPNTAINVTLPSGASLSTAPAASLTPSATTTLNVPATQPAKN